VERIQHDAAGWLAGEIAAMRVDLEAARREAADRLTQTLTPSVRATIIKAQIDDLIAHDEIADLRAMWAGMAGVDDFGRAVIEGFAPIALQRRVGDAQAFQLLAELSAPTDQAVADLARLERDRQSMVESLDMVATATRQADAVHMSPDTYLRTLTGAPDAPILQPG
jgi:hypothetical protein